MVVNLPPGCAVHRREDPAHAGAGWGHTEELLATLIELLDRHDRHFVIAHKRKGQSAPKALKVPRPRDPTRARRRSATGEELAAMVGRMGGARMRPEEVPS